jgi:2-C-methyl-D-erythritol 4-phosphate cytidylyltransferase
MTAAGFVVVLGPENEPVVGVDRSVLIAAGATAVLTWTELQAATEPGDAVAVLLDRSEPDRHSPVDLDELVLDVVAAVATLEARDGAAGPPGSAAGVGEAVIVTTRPVIDTLKLVDAEGALTGTADREGHRFVATPIAVRLRLLRAVAAVLPESPSAIVVLTALARQGVTVLGSPVGRSG